MISNFISLIVGLVVLVLVAFGALQWLHLPVGSFVDWLVGGGIFCWLLVIVTVPWNIHFRAQEVLAEAELSEERGIKIEPKQLKYVRVLAKRSRYVAIALHLVSTIVLYILAALGIGVLGYVGAIAALLLTILRPAVRFYEYLASRLAMIRQEFAYPHEDISELRYRFATLEETVKQIEKQLDPNEPYSWVTKQQNYWEETRNDLAKLTAIQVEMRATNHQEHERLAREAQQAIAQLSTDSQFLDHVREILRFFKNA